MTTLNWYELSKLPNGTRVIFEAPHDIFPECVVAAGTRGLIQNNYLNEMHNSLLVLPNDEALRETLKEWDGLITLGTHLDSGADVESEEPDDRVAEWYQDSPLALEVP